jgi:hypothetical protein
MQSRRWSGTALWRYAPLRHLLALGLPPEDFVVTGSVPLLLCGCRDDVADIDIVARGKAWAMAVGWGEVGRAAYENRRSIRLAGGYVEVLDGWFPSLFGDVQHIFEEAENIDGLAFMTVENTLKWKLKLDRDKDEYDIQQHGLAA